MNRAIRAAAVAAFVAAAPAGAPAHDDGSDRYVCHDDAATGRRHCHKEDETDWEGMPGRLAIIAGVGAAVWLATELLAGDPAPGRGLAPRVRDARPDVSIALYARARESGSRSPQFTSCCCCCCC